MIKSHNPYFNRWFSAIWSVSCFICMRYRSHNPYFNRWFSAIGIRDLKKMVSVSHNPYFNRWFSAIMGVQKVFKMEKTSQSLF